MHKQHFTLLMRNNNFTTCLGFVNSQTTQQNRNKMLTIYRSNTLNFTNDTYNFCLDVFFFGLLQSSCKTIKLNTMKICLTKAKHLVLFSFIWLLYLSDAIDFSIHASHKLCAMQLYAFDIGYRIPSILFVCYTFCIYLFDKYWHIPKIACIRVKLKKKNVQIWEREREQDKNTREKLKIIEWYGF